MCRVFMFGKTPMPVRLSFRVEMVVAFMWGAVRGLSRRVIHVAAVHGRS